MQTPSGIEGMQMAGGLLFGRLGHAVGRDDNFQCSEIRGASLFSSFMQALANAHVCVTRA